LNNHGRASIDPWKAVTCNYFTPTKSLDRRACMLCYAFGILGLVGFDPLALARSRPRARTKLFLFHIVCLAGGQAAGSPMAAAPEQSCSCERASVGRYVPWILLSKLSVPLPCAQFYNGAVCADCDAEHLRAAATVCMRRCVGDGVWIPVLCPSSHESCPALKCYEEN
jgi:hypothetical protein